MGKQERCEESKEVEVVKGTDVLKIVKLDDGRALVLYKDKSFDFMLDMPKDEVKETVKVTEETYNGYTN